MGNYGTRGAPGQLWPSAARALFLAGLTLQVGQPERLGVVLGGDGQGVEGHDQDHQPVEGPRLQHLAAFPAKDAVPVSPVPAEAGDGAGRSRTRAGSRVTPSPARPALAPPYLSPRPATQEGTGVKPG